MLSSWNVAGGGTVAKEPTKRAAGKGSFITFTIRKSRSTGN